jgi:hypothetical protein
MIGSRDAWYMISALVLPFFLPKYRMTCSTLKVHVEGRARKMPCSGCGAVVLEKKRYGKT